MTFPRMLRPGLAALTLATLLSVSGVQAQDEFTAPLTDLAKTGEAIPGYPTKETPLGMTITAISQVRPTAACASGAGATVAGQQVMRAMLKAGIAR